MKIFTFWGIALRSLYANKLRSSLTMLGIIIGIASVIAMLSLGEGFQQGITASISDLGSETVFIQPANPDAPGGGGMMSQALATPSLTLADAKALESVVGVSLVTAYNENFVDLHAGDNSKTTVIDGSTEGWLETLGYDMEYGQFFSERNVTRRDQVIVLGSEVAQDLFGSSSAALNEEVKLKGKTFTVIGVMAAKGGAMMGFSMDAMSVVPITTYQSKLYAQRTPQGEDAVQAIALVMEDADDKSFIIADVEQILRQRHRIEPGENDDFSVVTSEQILELVGVITGALTAFLAAIAAISLLVASIGIMNIMLVSVTERTREIGIRKAVGAKRYHILLQFLIEAGTLSLVGGVIGILLGGLTAWGVAQMDLGITLLVTIAPGTVFLAAGVSFFIGIVSGIYPAARAAALNPIDALRYG